MAELSFADATKPHKQHAHPPKIKEIGDYPTPSSSNTDKPKKTRKRKSGDNANDDDFPPPQTDKNTVHQNGFPALGLSVEDGRRTSQRQQEGKSTVDVLKEKALALWQWLELMVPQSFSSNVQTYADKWYEISMSHPLGRYLIIGLALCIGAPVVGTIAFLTLSVLGVFLGIVGVQVVFGLGTIGMLLLPIVLLFLVVRMTGALVPFARDAAQQGSLQKAGGSSRVKEIVMDEVTGLYDGAYHGYQRAIRKFQ